MPEGTFWHNESHMIAENTLCCLRRTLNLAGTTAFRKVSPVTDLPTYGQHGPPITKYIGLVCVLFDEESVT